MLMLYMECVASSLTRANMKRGEGMRIAQDTLFCAWKHLTTQQPPYTLEFWKTINNATSHQYSNRPTAPHISVYFPVPRSYISACSPVPRSHYEHNVRDTDWQQGSGSRMQYTTKGSAWTTDDHELFEDVICARNTTLRGW